MWVLGPVSQYRPKRGQSWGQSFQKWAVVGPLATTVPAIASSRANPKCQVWVGSGRWSWFWGELENLVVVELAVGLDGGGVLGKG